MRPDELYVKSSIQLASTYKLNKKSWRSHRFPKKREKIQNPRNFWNDQERHYYFRVLPSSVYCISVHVSTTILHQSGKRTWNLLPFLKWTLVFSMLCYSLYIGAQFYPKFYTLIPAAIVLGMGAAPMWSAKCTYLTQVGNKYAEVTGKSVEKSCGSIFFGIFFFFFQCSSILGHLISSLVLKRQKSNYTITEDDLSYCGINYCSARNTTDNFSVSDESRWMLSGIFLGCSLLSVVIASIFIDPLTKYGENERNEMGVEQGFFGADFTAAYVTCVLGINNVGYVLICYGVCDAVFSYFLGSLIKYVGRIPIFYFGAIINAAVILTFFYWTPRPDEIYVFYILSGLWGTADAVWQTQINAFYGVVFEGSEEAAFSNYRLWESLGFIVSYVLEHTVCVYTKVWVLVGVLSAGMIGYTVIEVINESTRTLILLNVT
ncbi:UNC93-like protein,Protein unc-93 homolog A [Lepeophtheirus salmonis]|uniref:UNC93-like protein,Protein unc-93 homolog A n=1 Tax=Lepeophtheirus salmonis TaxID=72036 RepID=A0A7R8HCI5_LEPSM|nr:UNC93-like protein,Protein unc-93 homolog A [Lepeophtheirus salmonis]CAF2992544.1 UNC93-like protein,Protein unc-93 homolog A [Lepeophtheirus salmonis]